MQEGTKNTEENVAGKPKKRVNFEKVLAEIEGEFTHNLDKFTLDNQKSYYFRLFSIHVMH